MRVYFPKTADVRTSSLVLASVLAPAAPHSDARADARAMRGPHEAMFARRSCSLPLFKLKVERPHPIIVYNAVQHLVLYSKLKIRLSVRPCAL